MRSLVFSALVVLGAALALYQETIEDEATDPVTPVSVSASPRRSAIAPTVGRDRLREVDAPVVPSRAGDVPIALPVVVHPSPSEPPPLSDEERVLLRGVERSL